MPSPLWRKMHEILVEAQTHRNERNGWLPDPETGRDTLDWILFERNTMFTAVNAERNRRGLEPISMRRFTIAESVAAGHVDYTSKFALYCAEMADGTYSPGRE